MKSSFVTGTAYAGMTVGILVALRWLTNRGPFGDLTMEVRVGGVILVLLLIVTSAILLGMARRRGALRVALQKKQQELEDKNIELAYAKEATLSVLKDLSVEKENLADAKAKDDAILAGIGDGVFVIDVDGITTLFNGAAERISGYPAAHSIGKPYRETLVFVDEHTGAVDDDFIASALHGKRTIAKTSSVLRRKDGTLLPVADSASPVLNAKGAVQGVVVVFRDVSDERRIDRTKSEFVSLASHQLSTPPTVVNYYAEMLLAGDGGKITKKQRTFLEEIYGAGRRMVDLVSGLLNATRLELGTFSVERHPVRVADVVESVLKGLALKIKEKHLVIHTSYANEDVIIEGDQKILLVILENLLTNACKYTPARGTISVAVEEKNDTVILSVADTGCGIPRSAQANIFSKMYRAPNAQIIDPQGTGLGLYVVKSLLDHIHGTIRFESEEGRGTTFYLELPKTGMVEKKGTTRIV